MTEVEKLTNRAVQAEELVGQLQRQVDYLNSRLKHESNKKQNNNANTNDLNKEQIEDLLLKQLQNTDNIDSREFGNRYNLHPDQVYGAINSLEMDQFVKGTKKQNDIIVLTTMGQQLLVEGSPEFRLYSAVPSNGEINVDKLKDVIPNKKEFNIALHLITKNGWCSFDKTSGIISCTKEKVEDNIKSLLLQIQSGKILSKNDITTLKKRKMIQNKKVKYYIVSKGNEYKLERVRPLSILTIEDIEKYMNLSSNTDTNTNEKRSTEEDTEEKKSTEDTKIDISDINDECNWTGPPIKELNINSLGKPIKHGNLHPLMKMRNDMRRILLDLGFEEMETNKFVESSFWNFDSLFQPQQHPARDAHDTFFISQPKESNIILRDYLKRVKHTHEKGLENIQESIGWRYEWKESEARKNLLRTHTTAISSRTLYKLAQNKPFKPKKYFSIDRVFRNESIDPTHLAEFHQVEGFVADYNLTLGHLIGTIAEFFKRIGIPDVKFKPAYNPYTEPSMEIFGWSEERNNWIEVGNSGVFRPEMLEPMGLPSNVKVIAWGLGLERPCMIATGCKDIRELFGPKVDITMVDRFPFVRYDREVHINETIQQIKDKNKNKN